MRVKSVKSSIGNFRMPLFCNLVRPPLLIYEQNMVIMFSNVIWEWFKGNLVLQLKQKH